jgi:hypothetical protein
MLPLRCYLLLAACCYLLLLQVSAHLSQIVVSRDAVVETAKDLSRQLKEAEQALETTQRTTAGKIDRLRSEVGRRCFLLLL